MRGGLRAFSVTGLGGGAVRDPRERVHAAVLNTGLAFPRKRMTANLAPAAGARTAPALDPALACGVLAAQKELGAARLSRTGLFAELGLGGDLRPCEGVAAAAQVAEQARLAGLIVAGGDLREVRAAAALPTAGLSSPRVVAALLAAGGQAKRPPGAPSRAGAATREGGRGERRASGAPLRPPRRASPNGAAGP